MAATSQDKDKYNDYDGFVAKFKPAKTTDDCYTPPAVYDAVCRWVEDEFGVDRKDFVRPFYPGGNYEAFDYPTGSVVVDNPPFSAISKIVGFFMDRNQPFFLFAPSLTLFTCGRRCCSIITNVDIVYQNGAKVPTSFVSNLDTDNAIRIEPILAEMIHDTQKSDEKSKKAKYDFPQNFVTAATLQKAVGRSAWGAIKIPKKETAWIRNLDEMKRAGKNSFGGGYLVSDRVAKAVSDRVAKAVSDRVAKADITWHLSDREQQIIDTLNWQGER